MTRGIGLVVVVAAVNFEHERVCGCVSTRLEEQVAASCKLLAFQCESDDYVLRGIIA